MRIRELDGLRGIAILAVVACHYMSWLPVTGAQHGWLGVDLFFVLSGFLITTILMNLRGSEHYFSVFYARRALRIFPPYYLAIAIYLLLSAAYGRLGPLGLWMRYIFYYSSLLQERGAELHGSHILVPIASGLGVLWSLSVEEVYYTIWAPVVRFTSDRVFTGILAGMIVIAPLLRWWMHTPGYLELFTFFCRMDALAMGSMVAVGILAVSKRGDLSTSLDNVLGWTGVVTGLLTVLMFAWLHGDRSNVLLSTVGITLADVSFALFLYSVIRRAGSSEWWVRMLRVKWLRSFGTISYSLYLFHYAILDATAPWIVALHLPRRVSAVMHVVVAFALSAMVSYGLWYLIESRILRWKDRHVPSKAEVSGGLEVAPEAVQA